LAILAPEGEQTVRLILGNYKHFQWLVMVRTPGLEPGRDYSRQILSRAPLPVTH